MSNGGPSPLNVLFIELSQQLFEASIVIPFLQVWKLRLRKLNNLPDDV